MIPLIQRCVLRHALVLLLLRYEMSEMMWHMVWLWRWNDAILFFSAQRGVVGEQKVYCMELGRLPPPLPKVDTWADMKATVLTVAKSKKVSYFPIEAILGRPKNRVKIAR